MTKIISRDEYDKNRNNKCIGKDDCPFCIIDKDLNTVLYESDHWIVFVALASYTGDDKHVLAFPKRHKIFYHELSDDEVLDLKNIYTFCEEYFGDNNYFSATRESMSNRSVEHYHMHFIQGKLKANAMIEMLANQ
ncbi:MAG: HIT family protein [Candidatus Gracilibacteria bacterium]|nr:HIT family protein [Candidatus Gracilibacteria bacterium]